MELSEINEQLTTIDQRISDKRAEVERKKVELDRLSLTQKIREQSILFTAKHDEKLNDITAKAKATIGTEAEAVAVMLKDAECRSAKIELLDLENKSSTLREICWNIRTQMKSFEGGS